MDPIWILYMNKNINNIVFNKRLSESYKDIHPLERRKKIYKAITWTVENPKFDFQIVAAEIKPFVYGIDFTNKEIYDYFVSFKNFMENEEYGLLTDDRPNNPPWRRKK